ncbi:TPA: hypothetical protein ACNIQM_002121 [Citrobacter werkmanii]
MKRVDDVLEKTLLMFGKGKTPEQQRRNQKNIAEIRKMIATARAAGDKKI